MNVTKGAVVVKQVFVKLHAEELTPVLTHVALGTLHQPLRKAAGQIQIQQVTKGMSGIKVRLHCQVFKWTYNSKCNLNQIRLKPQNSYFKYTYWYLSSALDITNTPSFSSSSY